MQIIISAKILSIPPYLSTSWKNISSIYSQPTSDQKFTLTITLNNQTQVVVPNIEQSVIDSIFEAHAKYGNVQETELVFPNSNTFTIPLGGNVDVMQSALQHNPEQAAVPEIPPEILEKIVSISKVLGIEGMSQLSKAEPHCNCPYCQITRALTNDKPAEDRIEEEVSDKDLQFRSWDVQLLEKDLYLVTNPLDSEEQYRVFLGNPLGCTCGSKTCEHIRAVLNS